MISRDSIMAEWDRWREYIAGGGTGSWPRDAFEALLDRHDEELERHKKWVNDLQSGMYINCVYCGHRYGPKKNTPVAMADVLKEHIEKCPKHPLSKTKEELERVRELIDNFLMSIRTVHLDMGGRHRYHLTHTSHERISELKAEAALRNEAKEKEHYENHRI